MIPFLKLICFDNSHRSYISRVPSEEHTNALKNNLHNTENLESRISVKIITTETDPGNLRLKEAV